MLRVEYARWGQSPEDLRRLAMSAPHARTRERALALYDIAQGSCATRVAARTGRHPQTVRSDCGGASRRRLRRPAYGRHPTPRGGRPGTTVDPQAADAVCA